MQPQDVNQPSGDVSIVDSLHAELIEARKWKEALIDACVVSWCQFSDDDPRKTINTLVAWNVNVALDPSVSQDAKELRDTYLESRNKWKNLAIVLSSQLRNRGEGLNKGHFPSILEQQCLIDVHELSLKEIELVSNEKGD